MSLRMPETDVDVVILSGGIPPLHAIIGFQKEELISWPNEGW